MDEGGRFRDWGTRPQLNQMMAVKELSPTTYAAPTIAKEQKLKNETEKTV